VILVCVRAWQPLVYLHTPNLRTTLHLVPAEFLLYRSFYWRAFRTFGLTLKETQSLPAGYVPVSACGGSQKYLKDLNDLNDTFSARREPSVLDSWVLEVLFCGFFLRKGEVFASSSLCLIVVLLLLLSSSPSSSSSSSSSFSPPSSRWSVLHFSKHGGRIRSMPFS